MSILIFSSHVAQYSDIDDDSFDDIAGPCRDGQTQESCDKTDTNISFTPFAIFEKSPLSPLDMSLLLFSLLCFSFFCFSSTLFCEPRFSFQSQVLNFAVRDDQR